MKFQHPLQERLREISQELVATQRQLFQAEQAWAQGLVAQGWQFWHHHSSYYGSHSEYGEGDVDRYYLFAPGVDLSQWRGVEFAHGHHGQHAENYAWHEWLDGLSDQSYVRLDNAVGEALAEDLAAAMEEHEVSCPLWHNAAPEPGEVCQCAREQAGGMPCTACYGNTRTNCGYCGNTGMV